MVFLPGTDQQVIFFLNKTEIKSKQVVITGPGTLEAAQKMISSEPLKITIIVDDYDSLITMRYRLEVLKAENIEIRMMDYENTDFRNESIDVLFAQASVSTVRRNKIIKEFRRILKTGGTACIGEIVKMKENPPAFVKDIWHSSDLQPLSESELEKLYSWKGFEIPDKKDLSFTLKDFYRQGEKMLFQETGNLSDEEKAYYKKLLKKISHESNAYLKLGGNEYMGFTAFIMRKK